MQNGNVQVGQPGQNPHSLVGRVEALEEAVEVLLIAQVCSKLCMCIACALLMLKVAC